MEHNSESLPTLNHDNFHLWKKRAMGVLLEKGVWYIIAQPERKENILKYMMSVQPKENPLPTVQQQQQTTQQQAQQTDQIMTNQSNQSADSAAQQDAQQLEQQRQATLQAQRNRQTALQETLAKDIHLMLALEREHQKAQQDTDKCKGLLFRMMSEDIRYMISDHAEPAQIWGFLETHLGKHRTDIPQLLQAFYNAKYPTDGNFRTHIKNIQELIEQFYGLGRHMANEDRLSALLFDLPPHLNVVKQIILNSREMKYEEAVYQLMREDDQFKLRGNKPVISSIDQDVAMFTVAKVPMSYICRICTGRGHFPSTCPTITSSENRNNNNNFKGNGRGSPRGGYRGNNYNNNRGRGQSYYNNNNQSYNNRNNSNYNNNNNTYQYQQPNHNNISNRDANFLSFDQQPQNQYPDSNQQSSETGEQVRFGLMSNGEIGSSSTTTWYLDSGATGHMTNNRNNICNFQELNKMIKLSDYSAHRVLGKGSVEVNAKVNDKNREFVLNDVEYVPSFQVNLLSLSKIESLGYKVTLQDGYCSITTKDGQLLLTSKRQNMLYPVELISKGSHAYSSITDMSSTSTSTTIFKADDPQYEAMLWHHRLGHLNNSHTQQLKKPTISDHTICRTCAITKQSRTPFPKASASITTAILDLVHTDVCGPVIRDMNGNQYFMTIIDDYSRFCFTKLMKTRTEVVDNLKNFILEMKTQHQVMVKQIRSDNAKEYVSGSLSQLVKEYGIRLGPTTPYSSQSNGVAERFNRTLVEKAKSMLFTARLSADFWGFAILAATHIKNRTPMKVLNDSTPFSKLKETENQINHLRVFGCRIFTVIPKAIRSGKFSSTSKESIFIGYGQHQSHYVCYDPNKKSVYVSRDVKFDELTPGGTLLSSDMLTKSMFDYIEQSKKNPVTQQQEPTPSVQPKLISSNEILCNYEATTPVIRTRSGRIVKPNSWYLDPGTYSLISIDSKLEVSNETSVDNSVCFLGCDFTVKSALSGPERQQWSQAMVKELQALNNNGTWKLVDLPPGHKSLPVIWVLKKKVDSEGKVEKFKARLVVAGNRQVSGIDFSETFAPVLSLPQLRLILSIAAHLDLEINHLDVNNAFLKGTIEEEIYVNQPQFAKDKDYPERVYKLFKSMYGLRQAPRCWNNEINNKMLQTGFHRLESAPSIYILKDNKLYGNDDMTPAFVAVYVDDLLIIAKTALIVKAIKDRLVQFWDVKDMGDIRFILNILVTRYRDSRSIMLSQMIHIDHLLEKHNLTTANVKYTPLAPGLTLTSQEADESEDVLTYQSMIGGIMYLMVATRPDIAHSVCKLSQFNTCASKVHMEAIKHLLRYLKCTKSFQLVLKPSNLQLELYSDSDYAADIETSKSTSGSLICLGGAPIFWQSKKQEGVALSTAEAEYLAVSNGIKQLKQLEDSLDEMRLTKGLKVKVFCDNEAALNIMKSSYIPRNVRHIRVKYHYVREEYQKGNISIHSIASADNPADILTKTQVRDKLKNNLVFFFNQSII